MPHMKADFFAKRLLARVADAVDQDENPEEFQKDIDALVKSFTNTREDVLQVLKFDEDQRMAWGWALVSVEKGQEVTDRQGDVVDTGELQQAVHGSFMSNGRVLKRMHTGKKIGEVVDSIVFTRDVQKALGINLGREGWFVGAHITDDATWAEVKAGKLPAFSIGGEAERHPMGKRLGPALFETLMSKADKPGQQHDSSGRYATSNSGVPLREAQTHDDMTLFHNRKADYYASIGKGYFDISNDPAMFSDLITK